MRELFKKMKITQKEVAKSTGISEAAISKYIKGTRTPSSRNLFKLANFFGLSIEDFWEILKK